MGTNITAIWGWGEKLQRNYHARAFTPGHWQIITVDGTDAGIPYMEYRLTKIYLGRISLNLEYQGRSIDSQLLRELLDQADE